MVGGTPCGHCRAGIQNGSRDTGCSRAFLNGQFRLLKAKIGKKTNNFPLCCQLRLRTATEWLSRVSCAVLTLGSACRINLRDCSAGGWPGQLYRHYYLAESVPVPGRTGKKNLNESPTSPVPWTSLIKYYTIHINIKYLKQNSSLAFGWSTWMQWVILLQLNTN